MSEYLKLHYQIRQYHGKANLFNCVDCGNQAYDWSHIAGTDPKGLDNYEPRCRSCHKKYDITDITRTRIGLASTGTRNGNAKLNDAKIVEIRQKYTDGGYSHQNLADIYGVSKKTITNIRHGKIWKSVR